MKKFYLVLFAVLIMVAAGFMGCATAVPLTNTDWLEYSNEEPMATIKTSASFNVLQIGKFDAPTHEKDNTYWSPISVSANTELAINGSFSIDVNGRDYSTTYYGREIFNCPSLSEGKSYTLKAEYIGVFQSIGKLERGLSLVLYDESGKWVVQQMIQDGGGGKQIFND